MDVKKFFADLFAVREPTDPPPPVPVADVSAAREAGRNAGYEAGHAEGCAAPNKVGSHSSRAPRNNIGAAAAAPAAAPKRPSATPAAAAAPGS